MREIVKRETIETSIAVGRSATHWCKPVGRVFGQRRVSVSLGFRREVRGRWVWPSGHSFIDFDWHGSLD